MRAPVWVAAWAAGALAAPGLAPETYELTPRAVTWEQLEASFFDPGWTLPPAAPAGEDLEADLRAMLAADLDLEVPRDLRGPAGPERLATFGDLAAFVGAVERGDRGEALEDLFAGDRSVRDRWGRLATQLLDDSRLLGDRWDPDRDRDDDGLVLGDGWDLPRDAAPWDGVGVTPTAEQGAVLVRADLTAFKEVENDYSVYDDDVGAGYESIGPVRGSLVTATDPDGLPVAAYRVAFEQDLPWPFGGYDCDLRVRNRLNAAGELEADIYATSSDFHWIAGRDRFLPVTTSAGDPVGHLVVRVYGFDLDGVPDGRKHRKAALRGSLGNLKRKAEARYAEAGPRDVPGELPLPPLRGRAD